MGLFKDQTTQIILLGLIFTGIVCYFILYPSVKPIEGFQSSTIPADAENPTLKNEQIYGIIPAAASASIFQKKDARDKTDNIDNLPFDKAVGSYYIQTFDVELNPDPNDIQNLLEKQLATEGFATAAELAAQAATDKAQNFVLSTAQNRVATTKATNKVADFAVKSLKKINQNLTTKISNKVGSKVGKKIAEKAAKKIAELVGRRAATATATGAVQTALPDPTGISKVFGIILTVIGAAGLAAQIAINAELKGDEGFCPPGYERLNGAIPSFMTKVPGIGDILDIMGAYVCYRNSCEANEEEDAGLCYDKCDKGYKGVGPVCWANSNDVGVGQLKECPAGWTNDGLTCREPIRCEPVRWDGCCRRGAWGECWGCARGGACSGGKVKGRAAGSDLPCPSSHPNQIDGLCYKSCPADTPNRVAGMPYLCSAAKSVGDGRGKTSYGRGVGRPKLKMKPVQKSPTPPPPAPPGSSSASFAADPNTTCKVDFASTSVLREICTFYYKSASAVPETVSNGLKFTYISRISKVVASSEQSCDIVCDLTTIVLPKATSKVPTSSTTVKDKNRRFYFAKLQRKCRFVVTAATNIDDTGKEVSNPDAVPTSVNFVYNPFV
jgi:hypothetical protein